MLAIDATFFPNPEKHGQYTELYARFCNLMEEQGYCDASIRNAPRGRGEE